MATKTRSSTRSCITATRTITARAYPDGLKGEDIRRLRIVAVADAYDALISWRPYRDPGSARRPGEIARVSAKASTIQGPDGLIKIMAR